MVKFITFVKLTEKALALPPTEAAKAYKKTFEITEAYGGKILETYATTGRYDFITISEYPDHESAFMARTKNLELGLFHFESADLIPVEEFLKAWADTRVAVAV